MLILVPIFYCTIFKFRKSQDLTPGAYNIIHMGKNLLVMDTFATCFVIFRLNPERYKYKLFINKVTYMDLIITQRLCFILFLVLE